MTYSIEQLKAMCPANIAQCSKKHVESVVADLIETALAEYKRLSPEYEQPASVPDGWKLVPVEPTNEMVWKAEEDAPRFYHGDPWYGSEAPSEVQIRDIYTAMLAAAPAAPAAPEQQPFGYFKAEPFGWVDCAETDEGAIALYEAPTQPDPEIVRDAERYRAIRGGMVYVEPHPGGEIYVATDRGVYCKTSSEVDDIIDAAIAAEKGTTA